MLVPCRDFFKRVAVFSSFPLQGVSEVLSFASFSLERNFSFSFPAYSCS